MHCSSKMTENMLIRKITVAHRYPFQFGMDGSFTKSIKLPITAGVKKVRETATLWYSRPIKNDNQHVAKMGLIILLNIPRVSLNLGFPKVFMNILKATRDLIEFRGFGRSASVKGYLKPFRTSGSNHEKKRVDKNDALLSGHDSFCKNTFL